MGEGDNHDNWTFDTALRAILISGGSSSLNARTQLWSHRMILGIMTLLEMYANDMFA